MHKKINFSEKVEHQIVEFYLTPKSITETAKQFNISPGSGQRIIKQILNKHSVPLHSKEKLESIRRKKISETRLNFSNEKKRALREKTEHTCLAKYGASNIFGSKEFNNICRNKYNTEFASQSDEVKNKKKKTCIDRYGVEYSLQSDEVKKKRLDTLYNNHTFNTSKDEENLYKNLLSIFTKDDIVRQYKDSRYKYNCDFYIKSLDLFIELNLHWTHGPHEFRNSKEDSVLLNNWKNKSINSKYYKLAIDTWTIRDSNKLNCFTINNLNYLIIYKNNHYKTNNQNYVKLVMQNKEK